MKNKKNRATQLTASTIINASKENVWNVLKEFGNIAAFHPLVKYSVNTNETTGLGARRHCDLLPMGAMEEEITAWEEGVSFTADVVGGKMLPPCHFMTGQLELEKSGNQTKVNFTLSYQMKYGVLGRIMNAIMIKPQFKKAPHQYVNGLKNYIELMESTRR